MTDNCLFSNFISNSRYPTFVNTGEKPYLEGDAELMTIQFKAKQKQKLNLKVLDGMLVDKYMNTVKF